MAKSMEELFEEFEMYGYVLHECPECGEECNATEIDNDEAYCEVCDKVVHVGAVI